MKHTSLALLIFISVAAFFSACKKNNVEAIRGKSSGITDADSAIIYQCTGNSVLPYICFDSLLMDSRCPAGVECVWQGTALIKVSFHDAANTHHFIMSLKGFPGLGFTSDTTINDYHIIFTDLKPYPDINIPDDEKPTAFFSITH